MKQSHSLHRENIAACILVGIAAFLCFFPLWVIVVNSFNSETNVTLNGFSIFPKVLTLDSFKYVLNNKKTLLLRAFGVSTVTVVAGTIFTTFVTICYAYTAAQDKQTVPFANTLSFIAWFATVFSGGVIPWYILTTQYYGLKNNLFALFVPYAINVFNMYIVRSSFRSTPRALIESAKLDGASELRVFLSIAIPLSKVSIVTIIMFTALTYWNDFFLTLYLITDSALFPVQKILYSMMSNITFLLSGSEATSAMADIELPANTARMVMTVLTVIPIAFVFPFVQKYFVKGITIGAIKG